MFKLKSGRTTLPVKNVKLAKEIIEGQSVKRTRDRLWTEFLHRREFVRQIFHIRYKARNLSPRFRTEAKKDLAELRTLVWDKWYAARLELHEQFKKEREERERNS